MNYVRMLTQSIWFRIAIVWAVVYGTYNTFGYSAYDAERSLITSFASSFDPAKLNYVAIGIGALAAFVIMTVLNYATQSNRSVLRWLGNLLIGLVVGLGLYVFMSGDVTNLATFLWFLFIAGIVLAVWFFFVRITTEMMGTGFMIFIVGLIAVGFLAFSVSTGVAMPIIGSIQAVIAMGLSIGIVYPSMRRRLTNVGTVFTSEQQHTSTKDAGHHGDAQ